MKKYTTGIPLHIIYMYHLYYVCLGLTSTKNKQVKFKKRMETGETDNLIKKYRYSKTVRFYKNSNHVKMP